MNYKRVIIKVDEDTYNMLLTLGKPEIIARKIIVNYFERLGEKREDMISELTDNVNNLVVTVSSLQKRVKALEDIVFTKKDHD